MYTPPTLLIKQAYVFDQVREAKALGSYDEHTAKEAKEEFDRWLENIKSEVFEEGIRLVVGGLPPHTTTAIFNANPYKKVI